MNTVNTFEVLEGSTESHGSAMGEVLRNWNSSPLRAMKLRSYLLDQFGTDLMDYQP